jgi:rubredoxin
MKRLLAGIIAAAIVVTMGTVSVMASPRQGGQTGRNRNAASCSTCTNGSGNCSGYGRMNFTDANGDGICDNCGNGTKFTDANGDGICDSCGSRANYADADGDGICDNRGNGQGCTDADGDGVCDGGTGTHPQDGTGMRYGRGRR